MARTDRVYRIEMLIRSRRHVGFQTLLDGPLRAEVAARIQAAWRRLQQMAVGSAAMSEAG